MNKAPTFGPEVLQIAPAEIFIPQRLGLFFPDKAAALGELMAVHGQRTPGTVRKPLTKEEKASGKPWVLIAGRHRLGGAELKDLAFVALERLGVSLEEALDEEASENLDRREQPPLERAIFIHATCEAAKARLAAIHGTAERNKLAAIARWNRVKSGEIRVGQALQEESDDAADTMSGAYNWQESVAEAFGRDKRTIRRAITLYRMVVEPFPELVQALSDHPVVGNNAAQLALIAGIDAEANRRKVIELLLADEQLSADSARVQVGIDRLEGREAMPHEKYLSQVTTGWGRLSLAHQRQAIPKIAAMLKTDGLKRELRDLLNQELGDA